MRLASMLLIATALTLTAHADGKPRRPGSGRGAVVTAAKTPENAAQQLTPARDAPAGHEIDTYRFGATYASRPGSSVLACETTCGDDLACAAWSFVEAYGAADARCDLKRSAGRAEENLLATSGLSPARNMQVHGRAPVAAPIDRDQLLSDASAAPGERLLVSSTPVLMYTPGVIQPPAAPAPVATPTGITLPMSEPIVSYTAGTPVPQPAPALRYAPATPAVTEVAAPATRDVQANTTYYPGSPSEGSDDKDAAGYYQPRILTKRPTSRLGRRGPDWRRSEFGRDRYAQGDLIRPDALSWR